MRSTLGLARTDLSSVARRPFSCSTPQGQSERRRCPRRASRSPRRSFRGHRFCIAVLETDPQPAVRAWARGCSSHLFRPSGSQRHQFAGRTPRRTLRRPSRLPRLKQMVKARSPKDLSARDTSRASRASRPLWTRSVAGEPGEGGTEAVKPEGAATRTGLVSRPVSASFSHPLAPSLHPWTADLLALQQQRQQHVTAIG